MLIFIPTGMKYTARAWASSIKEVTCVHCGAVFVYEMRRAVSTQSSAPLFIGMESAKTRAARNTQSRLQKELGRKNDDVPCPSCKRLQPDMNKDRRKAWTAVIIGVWIFVLIAAFFGYEIDESKFRPASTWVQWLPIVSTIIAIGLIVWLRFVEFRGTATDRAQLKSEAEAENFARLGLPRVVGDGWIWVRATLFKSPSVCARCGAEDGSKTCRRLLGGVPVEARVCPACYKRATIMRRLLATAAFVLPVTTGMLIAMRLADWDGIDVCFGFLGGGVVGGVMMAAMRNWVIRRAGFPIRFRKFRAQRDEVELKFASQAAAEAFLTGVIQLMQERKAAQASPKP